MREGDSSSYSFAHCSIHRAKASSCQTHQTSRDAFVKRRTAEQIFTFQYMKLTGSTTVGWTISRPGKIPQVTALGCMSLALVMFLPWKHSIDLWRPDVTGCDMWRRGERYLHVHYVIVHTGFILLQNLQKCRHVFTRCEELQVRLLTNNTCITSAVWPHDKTTYSKRVWADLLEDVSAGGTPAHDGIRGGFAVDVGLRVDGENSSAVHLLQLILQQIGLWSQRIIIPRQTHHLRKTPRARHEKTSVNITQTLHSCKQEFNEKILYEQSKCLDDGNTLAMKGTLMDANPELKKGEFSKSVF